MRAIVLTAITCCFMAAGAGAAPISVLVGDNDGFGVGIPDNGDGTPVTNGFVLDHRTADEAFATDGAHATDIYWTIFPSTGAPESPFDPFSVLDPSDPRVSLSADILFPFSGQLTAADVTIDFLDWQQDDYITATINGLALALGPAGVFAETFVRTYTLDPDQIAAANAAQQVALTLTLAAVFREENFAGDIVAFDFFRLDGELAGSVEPATQVPLPNTLALLMPGLAGLMLLRGRRRARDPA